MTDDEFTNEVREHYHMKALCEYRLQQLTEWLEGRENVTNVRQWNDNVDFTIGAYLEDWPEYGNDDHLRAIRGSSVETAYGPAWSDRWEHEKFVIGGNAHLPPTDEYRQDVIEDRVDLPEGFFMHFGTTDELAGFGGVNPAPDGVITPHIHVVDDVTFEAVRSVIEQAIEVFEGSVYNEGDNVLKEQP